MSALIHPSVVLSPDAVLAPDVRVGSRCVIEGKVQLGPGCVIDSGAHLVGPLIMGRQNHVFSNAVIGEQAQHLKHQDNPTGVEIGDENVFRENVTVHRGINSWTMIGNGNKLFTGAHIAHDCQVGNRCVLHGNALLGGHCVVADLAQFEENCAVHQWCRIGRLAVLNRNSITTMDIPPFVIQHSVNHVAGVNIQGMRESGLGEEQIDAIRRAYDFLFLQHLLRTDALSRIERDLPALDVVVEFVAFVRASQRGIARAGGGES